jgi:Flp pilus assembly protein TadD
MPSDSRLAVEEVLRVAGDGDLNQALALCQSKLAAAPEDVNLTALLGAILLKAGQTDGAEQYLQRAIFLEPEFAKPHEDLGALYLERNDPERAVTFYERAVALAGPLPSAVKGLAVALLRSGRTEEAEAIRLQHFANTSASPVLAQAHARRMAGDLPAAEKLCQDLLQKNPNDVAALRMLAFVAIDD